MNIIATARKWEHGWELWIDDEAATQVATLDKAAQQVRDYLDTEDPDTDHSDWVITIVGDIGDDVTDSAATVGVSRGRVSQPPIVSEITVPVDAATAYDALVDIGRWWDPRLSPEPATFEGVHVGAVGEPVVLNHHDAQYPIGTVPHAERGVRYDQTFTLAVDPEYPTTLSAEFVSVGGGTLVRLSHGGWTAGNAAERAKFTEWPDLLRRYAATLRAEGNRLPVSSTRLPYPGPAISSPGDPASNPRRHLDHGQRLAGRSATV